MACGRREGDVGEADLGWCDLGTRTAIESRSADSGYVGEGFCTGTMLWQLVD